MQKKSILKLATALIINACYFECFAEISLLESAIFDKFQPKEKTVFQGDARGVEFNQKDCLATWQDKKESLRVATIDPDTGDIDLLPKEIDVDLSPRSFTKNGPEWVNSDIGMQIVYTKINNNRFALYRARILNEKIDATPIEKGEDGFSPIGSLNEKDEKPRIVYALGYPGIDRENIELYWREIDDPIKAGRVSENPGGPARWIDNERSIVFTDQVNGVSQVFLLHVDTNEILQLTYDDLQKGDAFMHKSTDDKNSKYFFVVLEGLKYNEGFEYLSVYQNFEKEFIRTKQITPPSTKKYFSSPQIFVFEGEPFVSFLMSDVPFPPIAKEQYPSEIWIASINPENNFYRQVNDSNDQISRYAIEPEAFFLNFDVVIFYSVKDMDILRYAETGLGFPQRESTCVNN